MDTNEKVSERRVSVRLKPEDWQRLERLAETEGIGMPNTMARSLILKGLRDAEND